MTQLQKGMFHQDAPRVLRKSVEFLEQFAPHMTKESVANMLGIARSTLDDWMWDLGYEWDTGRTTSGGVPKFAPIAVEEDADFLARVSSYFHLGVNEAAAAMGYTSTRPFVHKLRSVGILAWPAVSTTPPLWLCGPVRLVVDG